MPDVLAIALDSLHQDMGRLDRIATNLANVSTPGYKREVAGARPFADLLGEAGRADGAAAAGGPALAPLVMLDGRAATQRSTGRALDLALTGEGFFEVATDDGPAYTRQGDFRIDAHGRLVTAGGQPLVGKGGGEIRLASSTPVIDGTGTITEPQAPHAMALPTGQLKIVRFDSLTGMRHLGQGLLSAGVNGSVMADADVRLHQGALENSGVDSMQEMVALMQTMRHAESMQRLAQGYDELMGTAIHKLGDLS